VFVRAPDGTWSQQAYLKASNTRGFDGFGASVAIAGDTIVVGAPSEDGRGQGVNDVAALGAPDAGAAYVFVRSQGSWGQQAYLKPSNTSSSYLFGASVAIANDRIVVGAPGEDSAARGVNAAVLAGSDHSAWYAGAAYVYTRSAGYWTLDGYLKADNADADDRYGANVAVSSDAIAVGASDESGSNGGVVVIPDFEDDLVPGSGAVYVY
jgi:hypothetical protein